MQTSALPAPAPLEHQLFPVEVLPPGTGLSQVRLPPLLRPDSRLGVLDLSEFYGESTGGVRTYLRQKARYFSAREDLRETLLLPGPEDSIRENGGVRCYRLRGPRIPTRPQYRVLFATRTVSRILDHERPDLIEIGSSWTAPWLARRAPRHRAIPSVWFYHDHFPGIVRTVGGCSAAANSLAELVWRYVRQVSRFCRATLAATEYVARELEHNGVERVRRVSLGVDLELFHPSRRHCPALLRERSGLPDGPLALFAGRFAPEKEIEVLLDAWREVERRTGTRLALVGHGPLQARLQQRADAGRFIGLPYQGDRSRLADLMAAVDLG